MRRGRFFSLALKDGRVEQCLRSCGSEFQTWGPKQESCICIDGFFSAWGCQKKSEVLRVLSFRMEQHTHSSHSVDLGFRRFNFMDNFKRFDCLKS